MKISKTVTDAIAIMLAIFIFIYIITGYVKYDPSEKELEEASKLSLFLDNNEASAEMLHLGILLFISGILGMALKWIPELTVFTSMLALSFALCLYKASMLTKHPMVITILSLSHFLGAIVYCAYLDRNPSKKCRHSFNAAAISAITGLGTTGYLLYRQNTLRSLSDIITKLQGAEIVINNKVKFNSELMELISLKYDNYGTEDAAEFISKLSKDIEFSDLKMKILNEITADQFRIYIRFGIVLLAALVFYIVLRRVSGLLSVIPTVIPAVYVVFNVHSDKMLAMSLPLMVMTVSFFICAFAGYEQAGKGHDKAYDPDPDETEKQDENSDDEITYT